MVNKISESQESEPQLVGNKVKAFKRQFNLLGRIPYTALGAQIAPPSLILDFNCFYAYFKLSLVCPAGL